MTPALVALTRHAVESPESFPTYDEVMGAGPCEVTLLTPPMVPTSVGDIGGFPFYDIIRPSSLPLDLDWIGLFEEYAGYIADGVISEVDLFRQGVLGAHLNTKAQRWLLPARKVLGYEVHAGVPSANLLAFFLWAAMATHQAELVACDEQSIKVKTSKGEFGIEDRVVLDFGHELPNFNYKSYLLEARCPPGAVCQEKYIGLLFERMKARRQNGYLIALRAAWWHRTGHGQLNSSIHLILMRALMSREPVIAKDEGSGDEDAIWS